MPQPQRQVRDVNLSPTGRPGAAKRLLRIVAVLVVTAIIIAGIAWLTGNVRYRQDYQQMTETMQSAVQQPARAE